MFRRRAKAGSDGAFVAWIAVGVLCLGSPAPAKPTLISFDPPGSTQTNTVGIDDAGTVAGYYYDGTQYQGFLRGSDGTFATFSPPGSIGTFLMGISGDGTTTGFYLDSGDATHGFVRAPDGTITSFDAF